MTDYIGTDKSIALQKRVHARQSFIDGDINLVNGGRLMHFLDPEENGWDTVRRYAEEDQIIGFPAVKKDKMISLIHKHLGTSWKTPVWSCLVGGADRVLDYCRDIVNSNRLPINWSVIILEQPSTEQVDEIQC